MEFLIAAALSGTSSWLDALRHRQSVRRVRQALRRRRRQTRPRRHTDPMHERYKVDASARSTACSCDIGAAAWRFHVCRARDAQPTSRTFSTYWVVGEDWVARALNTGTMRTAIGWTCRTGITEFNARSIGNFPVQATGADILRIACIWAHRRGIDLCASVHDAVLIEAPADRIEADVALMWEIMRRASRIVLNANPTDRMSSEPTPPLSNYPDRYRDKRGDRCGMKFSISSRGTGSKIGTA